MKIRVSIRQLQQFTVKNCVSQAVVVVQQRDAAGMALRQHGFGHRYQWRDATAAADQEQFFRLYAWQHKIALRRR